MISFIVIGRNEGKNLKKCIQSIYATIEHNTLIEYEIIYVDSKSTDDSIKTILNFTEIKIFKITGYCNAAVGRNIGASESSGNVLYFIDADMEIRKEFLQKILNEKKEMKYDAVSGIITDVENGAIKTKRYINKNDVYSSSQILDGGIFLIKKDVWNAVKGMRTKLNNGEDGDLGLRLYKSGFYFIRINQEITLHNTIDYLDNSRIWKMLLDKSIFHCRCVLYRNHLNNKYMYYRIWKDDKTFIFLVFTLISFLFKTFIFESFIFIYIVAIFLRSLKRRKYSQVIKFLSYYIISDLMNLIFFFTLFPKEKELKYFREF